MLGMSNTQPSTAKTAPPALMFRLRLKDRHDIREVVITARDIDRATRVGNTYCEQNKFKFIRVENMVVAGEEILTSKAE